MELSDIYKMASGKKMNAEVEKLREKVAHETATVIKLKVAQDVAYWDLKEKLQAVDCNHEQLQRNMVDVQMENETVSARLQEELRLRPDMVNKLVATRGICDVLQDHVGRVRASLQRCTADRAALAAAYGAAASSVDAAHADHSRRTLQAATNARALQDQVAMSKEHAAHLAECVATARHQAEEVMAAARTQLAAAADDAARLRDHRDALLERLGRSDALLEERERAIAELRGELQAAAAELAAQGERARSSAVELEREAGAAAALREKLAGAEGRVEAVAAARDEAARRVEHLQRRGEEAQMMIDELKRELSSLAEKNKELLKTIDDNDKVEIVADFLGTKPSTSKMPSAPSAANIQSLEERASEVSRENDARADEQARLDRELGSVRADRDHARGESERARADAAAAEGERARTIARLMRDLAAETEARARAEAALHAARADLDGARDDCARAHSELRRLADSLRSKEDENAEQMKIILDTRGENERLQEKILDMQKAVDNVQRALKRDIPRPPADGGDPPEHDDNAMAGLPVSRQVAPGLPFSQEEVHPSPKPRANDTLLYTFFSDSSDTLDPADVTRRFKMLARGALPPPTSKDSVKRRRDGNQVAPAQEARRSFFKCRRPNERAKKQK